MAESAICKQAPMFQSYSSGTISVPNNKDTTMINITLPAGIHLITGTVIFQTVVASKELKLYGPIELVDTVSNAAGWVVMPYAFIVNRSTSGNVILKAVHKVGSAINISVAGTVLTF